MRTNAQIAAQKKATTASVLSRKNKPKFRSRVEKSDGEHRFIVTVHDKSRISHTGPYPNKKGVVGSLTSYIQGKELVVDDTYLDPPYQGKGNGKSMYKMALKKAGKLGLASIRSYDRPSAMAQNVWKSLGGKQVGHRWEIPTPRKSGQDSAHLGQHGRPGGHAGFGK